MGRRPTVVSMLVGLTFGLNAAAFTDLAAAQRSTAPIAPEAPLAQGGFRLATDPKIETVFGDAAEFRRYVDRFFVVYAEMYKTREDFARNIQNVLASLAAHRAAAREPGAARKCPVDAVGLAYGRAFRQGQTYHRLGKELETNFVSIKELDALGETKGLTPDYRWKVARALKFYGQVLTDFREMRVTFQDQLPGELTFNGCDSQILIAKGEELEKSGAAPLVAPPVAPPATVASRGGKTIEPPAPVVASGATFFVDNSTCKTTSLRVFLDGTLLGEVGSGAKAAFRALVGRHDLCLIPSSSRAQCGDPGTLRKTYIHDGWAIVLRCDR
jgi:hypothetical protein